jgi:competence protein ComEC
MQEEKVWDQVMGDSPWRAAALDWFRTWAQELRQNLVIWLSVAFTAGAGAYFTLAAEPGLWLPVTALMTFAVAAWRRPPGSLEQMALILLAAFTAGLAWPTFVAQRAAAPVLEHRTRPLDLTARVLAMEDRGQDLRLLLAVEQASGLEPVQTPEKVRLSVRTDATGVSPGQRIRTRAVLWPPPRPSFPGDHDTGRELYFQGIGALGITVAAVQPVTDSGEAAGLAGAVERLRLVISERFRAAIPGNAGLVADALITGFRGAMPPDLMQAIRDAGLAHLLAISGLHMAMVAGMVFFSMRFLLALVEPWALKYPIKKWAAVAAIAGSYFYLLVSGQPFPAERAFIMTSMALVAVLLDRRAITMRMVALAALAVLLMSPQAITSISFQMSFAAVVALVAFYEHVRTRDWRPEWLGDGLLRRVALMSAAAVATTLVSELAVAPATLYHFGQMPLLGIIANAIAIPLTGLIIMPMLLLSLCLMPLGMEALPLMLAGRAIEIVIIVAEWCAKDATGMVRVPVMPLASYAVMMAGGLWLALWKHPVRLLGLAGVAAGLWLMARQPLPDIWVAGDGRLVAVRLADGTYAMPPGRADRWERNRLMQWTAGQVTDWPRNGVTADGRLRCDGQGCVYKTATGQRVALPKTRDALDADCGQVDVVIADFWLPKECAALAIGRRERRDNGGYALTFGADGMEMRTVGQARNARPWGGG